MSFRFDGSRDPVRARVAAQPRGSMWVFAVTRVLQTEFFVELAKQADQGFPIVFLQAGGQPALTFEPCESDVMCVACLSSVNEIKWVRPSCGSDRSRPLRCS